MTRAIHPFMRIIAAVVVVAFGGMVTAPAAAAMHDWQEPAPTASPGSEAERLAQAVVETREQLRRAAGHPDAENRIASIEERREARERLKALRTELRELDQQTRAEFSRVGELVVARNLPPAIAARHAAAQAEYDTRANALLDDLETIETADEAAAFERASQAFERIENLELERGHQPFDPHNLPNRSLQPVEDLTPKLAPEDYIAYESVDLSRALAANEGFDLSGLMDADDAAYLAPTTEVVLSESIQAKAAELGHDPVAIYNWVRNTVQWQPYWGAVQDAELTLSAQRGTAQDIAGLTIALLRASGIPARYAHGAIELPEDKFRNWMGGFEHIGAAIHFAASGGIPLAPVVSGGQGTKVQLQHVWVEAALDFAPSRGAVNRAADAWVPMDPSFKQYEILEGLDPVAIAGLDPEALAADFLASGSINEAEGWVTGFDPAVLADAQQTAAQALEDHIATNLPEATVGDVLGGRRIVEQHSPILAGTLETEVLVTGARYAALPDGLRQHMVFGLGSGHSVTLRWAEINNQRITLSFRPATPADEEALLSLLPEGEITDISQLPDSIPSYLVEVVPELKLGDEVILTGDVLNLGEEVRFTYAPLLAGGRIGAPNPYNVIAGSYLAVSANAGNVAPAALEASRDRIEATRAVLEGEDPAQRETLTREELLGETFHAGLLTYYDLYVRLNGETDQQQGGHHFLAAGLGTYGYEPDVHTVLGLPMAIEGGGAVMNIPILNIFGHDNDGTLAERQQRFDYVIERGVVSSTLEHLVPDMMFNQAVGNDAVSAVSAIESASRSGQRIYHLTNVNSAEILPELHHSTAVINEISAALSAGREVITHSDPITLGGWSGAGYIIVDPVQGDGAYKISGGTNGGFKRFAALYLYHLAIAVMAAVPLFLVAVSGPLAIFMAVIMSAQIVALIRSVECILNSNQDEDVKSAQIALISTLYLISAVLVGIAAKGPAPTTAAGRNLVVMALLLILPRSLATALSQC